MRYNQIVSLKNINFKIVSKSFREIKFVNFLISFQPVKIISWEGVENNKKAHFKLWFFGWKNFKVKHSDFSLSDETLTFTDKGEVLPFGLTNWNHIHTVKEKIIILLFMILYLSIIQINLSVFCFIQYLFPQSFLEKFYIHFILRDT